MKLYVSGDGFLIVYSVTDRASYDHVPEFHDLILRVKDESVFELFKSFESCFTAHISICYL